MTARNEAKWTKMKALGREKYVLFYGVLLWGVTLTVVTSAIQYILTKSAPDADALTWKYVIARFIVFGIIGFFAATGRWLSRQRKFGSEGTAAKQTRPSARR
jgi:hypothetical protein